MRLKLEKLRETLNQPGTVGTMGTANVYADHNVPSVFPSSKRVGTDTSAGWSSVFPVFPSGGNERERAIGSVYAAVPAVPNVPIETPLIGDPKSWENELHRWAKAHCVFRDRAWGGLVTLHKDYVEWSHATGNIPPASQATFRVWVVWQGFTLAGSLVHGLVLAEDMKSAAGAVFAHSRKSEPAR